VVLLNARILIMLLPLLAISPLAASVSAEAAQMIELAQTENHHIAELNSNQPYVAGYHVKTLDLLARERVQATAVTVSFPLTDPGVFPQGSWLGAGMFVQSQENKIINVDYAFYTMLVLDDSGDFFLDIGLHQTRELSVPLQMPTEELIFAQTWHISGMAPTTPVTLLARCDSEGCVHYSLTASETTINVSSVNVAGLPKCETITRQFYAGIATNGNSFPLGHYVYYFQFGVISSEIIPNNHWSVDLKDPQILRKTDWNLAEAAFSIQGDVSYLDSDWMWGGMPYDGVPAQYYQNPLENPYEVIFFYDGRTLPAGTILWQDTSSRLNVSVAISFTNLGQALTAVIAVSLVSTYIRLRKLRKRAQETS